MSGKPPLVSVVVTTRNEATVIGRLLDSIRAQSYRRIEIILVDNHSTDKTVSIARDKKVMVFTFGPERSAQRNFGVKKSKGELVLILDADMELSSEVIKESVNEFAKSKQIGAVVIPEESKFTNFWGQVKAFERTFYNLAGDETTDAARFFRRSAFDEVGGYDESITGPEDWDLPENIRRCGYQIGRIKALIYHYEKVSNPWDLARKKYYYGLKSSRYLSKNKINMISPKTIYFLRPVFYRQWRRILAHPLMSAAMLLMLTIEQFGGGLGYLKGRLSGP